MNRPSHLIRTLLLLGASVLIPLSKVSAHTVNKNCIRQTEAQVAANVQLNIGRDVQVNDPISGWFSINTAAWQCTHKGIKTLPRVQMFIGPAAIGLTRTGGHVEGYPVYLWHGGVGFIARVRHYVDGVTSSSAYAPVTAEVGMYNTQVFASPKIRKPGDKFNIQTELQLRLVKLAGDIGVHPTLHDFQVIRVYPATTSDWSHPNTWDHHASEEITYRVKLRVYQTHAACTTPGFTVNLGKVDGSDLPVPGSHGPATNFALRFENCPKYIRAIHYRFEPVPAGAVVHNGVLPLDINESTAAGVGVQVLHPNGAPLAFTPTWAELTEYKRGTPEPVYTVPLKARIIRTGSTLNGGSVHTAMKMVVQYK